MGDKVLERSFRILIEFKEPVSTTYWDELMNAIKKLSDEYYVIEKSNIYVNDVYKCASFIVSLKKGISPKLIKNQLYPVIERIRSERNFYDLNTSRYHDYKCSFFDVALRIDEV